MTTLIVRDGVEYRVFNRIYAVSRCGQLLKIKTLSPAASKLRKDGYMHIGRQMLTHRVVALCWLEKPEGATHVHHKNHIKTDNRVENLEWLTPKQHMAHHPEGGRYVRTEETKEKLRQYRLGRKTSEETKQKQREANLRSGTKPPPRPVGVKHSSEAIAKMRQNSSNAVRCKVDGVVYNSFADAGRALGVRPLTLRKRCLSTSFNNHELVENDEFH